MFLRRPSEDFLLLLECFLWYKKRMIRIYNTLTNKKEDFEPANDKRVNFFVCGPTVYDSSHIGHARTYISFDVIVKYLRYAGYEVFYLQNITDVDDKIIARAHETEEDPLFLSRHFAKEYFEDMQELKITSPSKYASASEFIPQIIKQIETLVKKGVAYSTPSGVYYDITKFPEYGKLSHQNQSTLLKAVRIEEDPNKQNDFDFVLWKAKKPGEPFWQSPWGEGRPGWHIEDTAISEYFFGPQYDVHGGGIDLKFPHHESEIAQQEAASDKVPFVKYWLHTGHLQVEKQKMSKSLKNFITIRDILKKHSSEAFRLLVLQNHYRSPINFAEAGIAASEEGVKRLGEFMARLQKYSDPVSRKPQSKKTIRMADVLREKFVQYMDDDFNAPKAIAEMFSIIKKTNALMDKRALTRDEAHDISHALKKIDSVFGIIPKAVCEEIPEEIKKLAELREQYRKEKRWKEADTARSELLKRGFVVEDGSSGHVVKRK